MTGRNQIFPVVGTLITDCEILSRSYLLQLWRVHIYKIKTCSQFIVRFSQGQIDGYAAAVRQVIGLGIGQRRWRRESLQGFITIRAGQQLKIFERDRRNRHVRALDVGRVSF